MFTVPLPAYLRFQDYKSLAATAYPHSIHSDVQHVVFDWSHVTWVCLPELLSLLVWSSKLVRLSRKVTWSFPDPRAPIPNTADLRFFARGLLGEEKFSFCLRQIQSLRQRAFTSSLRLGTRVATFNRLRELSRGAAGQLPQEIEEWLAAEETAFTLLDVRGYLARYKAFERANESGIAVTPDFRELPSTPMDKSPQDSLSPCLELTSILTSAELAAAVGTFSNADRLREILGEFADPDFAAPGALADILVTETGTNVEEHAGSTAAWICTRLVRQRSFASLAQADPCLEPLRHCSPGFLEVIVADNGSGLTNGLDVVFDKDQRYAAHKKDSRIDRGHYPVATLIDYAFDRLSSTKRDVVALLHLDRRARHDARVASGLYWVWNEIRSHRGVLSVRTGDVTAWYDFFSQPTDATGPQAAWHNRDLQVVEGLPFPGTMIRLCLPIHKSHQRSVLSVSPATAKRTIPEYKAPRTTIVDVADLLFLRPTPADDASNASPLPAQDSLPLLDGPLELRLLKQLLRKHHRLSDDEILVLDLCGINNKHWVMETVHPLCHFFVEMNYTASLARSAVVLWNVPKAKAALFESSLSFLLEDLGHLRGLRRASMLVWDDFSLSLVFGWPRGEELLRGLFAEGTMLLSDLRLDRLDDNEQDRVASFLRENAHFFDLVDGASVTLRPWPFLLHGEYLKTLLEWYNTLIDREVSAGGVHHGSTRGYFLLPSTGRFVKEFFQFSSVLSNLAVCSRIRYLVSELLLAIASGGPQDIVVVSVTRSLDALLAVLFDRSTSPRLVAAGFRFLSAPSVQALRDAAAEGSMTGRGVFLTDVVSSGTLCEEVAACLPHISWKATVALLDASPPDQARESHPTLRLGYGLELPSSRQQSTGPVYALARRNVPVCAPGSVRALHLTAVDRVNVCPIKSVDKPIGSNHSIWSFLATNPDALTVGHLETGNYHHYIYYVDVVRLLFARVPAGDGEIGGSLLSRTVADIKSALGKGATARDLVILHPPPDSSRAEHIAKAIQEETGALVRHVLYRDNVRGQWLFTPYVDHGIPLKGKVAIIVDDGTNSGDTVMGLLDLACACKPSQVVIVLGVNRMPIHKSHLLERLDKLRGVDGRTTVHFATALSIPVYGRGTCPVCERARKLDVLRRQSAILAPYALRLQKGLRPRRAAADAADHDEPFPYSHASLVRVARIREAMEMAAYHEPSSTRLATFLHEASVDGVDGDADSLQDLAFILCCEPQLCELPIVLGHLERLCRSAARCLQDCDDRVVLTMCGLLFHCLFRARMVLAPEVLANLCETFWKALFCRHDRGSDAFGRALALLLTAGTSPVDGTAPSEGHSEADLLAAGKRVLTAMDVEKDSPSWLFSRFLLVEAQSVIAGDKRVGQDFSHDTRPEQLFALVGRAAGQFWWHASSNVKLFADELARAAADTNAVRGHLRALLEAITVLSEARSELLHVEHLFFAQTGESLALAEYWGGHEIESALATVSAQCGSLISCLDGDRTGDGHPPPNPPLPDAPASLRALCQSVTVPFSMVFPEVTALFDELWVSRTQATALPTSTFCPVQWDNQVNRSDQVFFPKGILTRFVENAVRNLETAAFSGWTPEQLTTARAQAFVRLGQRAGHPTISLRIVDNGPLFPRCPCIGQQRGLSLVALVAQWFGARLSGPTTEGAETFVQLELLQRTPVGATHE